jgi:hypothetical protein
LAVYINITLNENNHIVLPYTLHEILLTVITYVYAINNLITRKICLRVARKNEFNDGKDKGVP